jgi:hypothetical protein
MWKLCPHFPDTMAMVSKVRDVEAYDATHIGCNHRRGICRLDMSHQSGPGRYRRHRPLEYPTSRSRRRSTF